MSFHIQVNMVTSATKRRKKARKSRARICRISLAVSISEFISLLLVAGSVLVFVELDTADDGNSCHDQHHDQTDVVGIRDAEVIHGTLLIRFSIPE